MLQMWQWHLDECTVVNGYKLYTHQHDRCKGAAMETPHLMYHSMKEIHPHLPTSPRR